MFAEWVTKGAAFGIEAFFALVTFGLIALAVLGFVGVIAKAVTPKKDGDKL